MAHPLSQLLNGLFLEITIEEAFEALAMACFILSHLVNGVVDSIPAFGLGVLGNAELVLTSASLGVHALLKVGLGVPNHVTEKFCELGCMLSLLPCITTEGFSNFGIALTVGLTAHGQILANFRALTLPVCIEVLNHFLIYAIFLGDADHVLLNKLEATSLFNELLELRSGNSTLWTTLGWRWALMNITANGANPFLLHNSLILKLVNNEMWIDIRINMYRKDIQKF